MQFCHALYVGLSPNGDCGMRVDLLLMLPLLALLGLAALWNLWAEWIKSRSQKP
jgi:hypothetical protein